MAIPSRAMPALSEKDIERFRSLVGPADARGCRPWMAGTDTKNGYGKFSAQGATLRAHRVAYFLATALDPVGRLILHTCDNPPCCEESHLFDGTPQDNTLDCKAKGRLNTASGDRHGTHTKPERKSRGERAGGAKLTEEAVANIRAAYLAGGVTHQQLADRYGVKRETVSRIFQGRNWHHTDDGQSVIAVRVGMANRGAGKLDKAAVADIRRRYASGEKQVDLAVAFSVNQKTISAIVTRKIWRHVV